MTHYQNATNRPICIRMLLSLHRDFWLASNIEHKFVFGRFDGRWYPA